MGQNNFVEEELELSTLPEGRRKAEASTAEEGDHEFRQTTVPPTKGDRVLDVFIISLLIVIAIIVFYPLYIVLISSISDPSYISAGQVWLLPRGLNLEAYHILLDTKEIWVGYRNSLMYTVGGTALQMMVTTAAGFALSRRSLPGRRWLSAMIVFTMYFSAGMIPTYLVIQKFGMINTVWALIVPVLVGPYNLVISRNYFENSIPDEIYESAMMDGANMLRCFAQFAVPLAKPVLAVMVLNFALGHWNKYFEAMIYINDDSIQTLQVFIKRITMQATATLESPTGGVRIEDVVAQVRKTQLLKYAVVVVSSVPMIILYPMIQKYFIQGIMLGSVKS